MVSEILVHGQLAPFLRACLVAEHHGSMYGRTKSPTSQTAKKREKEEPETNCPSRNLLLPPGSTVPSFHPPPTDPLSAFVD